MMDYGGLTSDSLTTLAFVKPIFCCLYTYHHCIKAFAKKKFSKMIEKTLYNFFIEWKSSIQSTKKIRSIRPKFCNPMNVLNKPDVKLEDYFPACNSFVF